MCYQEWAPFMSYDSRLKALLLGDDIQIDPIAFMFILGFAVSVVIQLCDAIPQVTSYIKSQCFDTHQENLTFLFCVHCVQDSHSHTLCSHCGHRIQSDKET